MATRKLPDYAYIRERFDYDPNTGELIWRERPDHCLPPTYAKRWNLRWAGKQAASVKKDRNCTCLDYRTYQTHRLIWKWMTGEDPVAVIDHIDGNPSNNRWNNLRAATQKQNARNNRGHRAKPLPKGIYPRGRGWCSRIKVDDRQIHLGTFDTIEEAHRAYIRAAREHFGEFANPGKK